MFNWECDIALHEMQGNHASSPARGKCHGIFRVAAGTWGMFSSYHGVVIKKFCLFIDVRTPV